MKIKLIAPARKPEWGESFWDMRGGAKLIRRRYSVIPLALPTLAALTPPHIKVEITDENIEAINFSEKVDLVGITFNTPLATRAYEIAREFKAKGITVIGGGMHASALPDEALRYVDSVVVGEAENVWVKLLNDFRDGKLQKVYHSLEKPSLENSPIPRWDLTKYQYYTYFTIQTARGCPFNCEFCSVKTFFGDRIRYKSIENILEEMKFIKSLDSSRQFVFADDNIVSNAPRAKQLFEALIPLNLRNWAGQAPITIYKDVELLNLLYESGCRQLLIGLETLDDDNLGMMGKQRVNVVKEYQRAISVIHSHGIAVMGCFIVGNDHDDRQVFKKIYNFIMDNNVGLPQITILSVL